MKYVVILGDGMADYKLNELNNKTPLEYAKKPNIDSLTKKGILGLVKTVPSGLAPGSDTANLSVMGYDPRFYYTGRSPIEAVSLGIDLSDNDTAIRCNLVTLSEHKDYNDKIMLDYSADEITTSESRILIGEINNHFKTNDVCFYPGKSYRHLLVIKDFPVKLSLTPPHDILNKRIGEYININNDNKKLFEFMKKSNEFLKEHDINKKRMSNDLNPANSIWLWGEGKKLSIPSFLDKFKLHGSVISAVDLIKGIGISAGLDSIEVPYATGNIHTNYLGKASAALQELKSGKDFVFVHIEAPDECGHRFEIENKVKSIELIDELVVGSLLNGLEEFDDYKMLILPDHPTPLCLRTHTSDPVPFLIYHKKGEIDSGFGKYDEDNAQNSDIYINEGHTLMNFFLSNN